MRRTGDPDRPTIAISLPESPDINTVVMELPEHAWRRGDAPFIATVSSPNGWVAATHALNADSVWTNPARTCQHADPSAPLPPRSRATLRLKLHLLRGGIEDAWRRVADARKAGTS